MPKKYSISDKSKLLKENGTLNKNFCKVKDSIFQDNPFFDARDIVQVKYEMLRAVEKDGRPVSETAEAFGFSRVSFYKAHEDFKNNGMEGLLPRKRGPQGASKLTWEIMDFINEKIKQNPGIAKQELIKILEADKGIKVHRRTIEKALAGGKKKQRERD